MTHYHHSMIILSLHFQKGSMNALSKTFWSVYPTAFNKNENIETTGNVLDIMKFSL